MYECQVELYAQPKERATWSSQRTVNLRLERRATAVRLLATQESGAVEANFVVDPSYTLQDRSSTTLMFFAHDWVAHGNLVPTWFALSFDTPATSQKFASAFAIAVLAAADRDPARADGATGVGHADAGTPPGMPEGIGAPGPPSTQRTVKAATGPDPPAKTETPPPLPATGGLFASGGARAAFPPPPATAAPDVVTSFGVRTGIVTAADSQRCDLALTPPSQNECSSQTLFGVVAQK